MDVPADTTPEVHCLQAEGLRAMGPEGRLRLACELTRAVRELARARIRQEHPADDERTIRLRLAALWIDRDLLRRAFGALPPDL
jgi:hypothetical protein